MTYAYIPNVIIQMIMPFLTKSVTTMAFIMINMKVIATIIDGTHQMSALSIVSKVLVRLFSKLLQVI